MKKSKLVRLQRMLRHAIVWALLAAPIAIYVDTFGSSLSHNHEYWSQMGSAMSGIYGPILALLGFGVLAVQLMLQQQTTRHMFDQTYIQTASADLAFYLSKLEVALAEKMSDGTTVRSYLDERFKYIELEQLRAAPASAAANFLNTEHPQISAAWLAIQSIFGGLAAGEGHAYVLPPTAAKQKAVVVLSYAMCVTLDHYVWCVSGGRLRGPYFFSNWELPHIPG